MIIVKFTIAPMGAVRQTRADAWKNRPAVLRYRAFKDSIRVQAAPFHLPPNPLAVDIDFFIAMPESWSGKKKAAMDGCWHRQKPDIDNLWKAVTDTLWPDDDSCIAYGTTRKAWSKNGGIIMTVHVGQDAP